MTMRCFAPAAAGWARTMWAMRARRPCLRRKRALLFAVRLAERWAGHAAAVLSAAPQVHALHMPMLCLEMPMRVQCEAVRCQPVHAGVASGPGAAEVQAQVRNPSWPRGYRVLRPQILHPCECVAICVLLDSAKVRGVVYCM